MRETAMVCEAERVAAKSRDDVEVWRFGSQSHR
jgi:hypothetical protein